MNCDQEESFTIMAILLTWSDVKSQVRPNCFLKRENYFQFNHWVAEAKFLCLRILSIIEVFNKEIKKIKIKTKTKLWSSSPETISFPHFYPHSSVHYSHLCISPFHFRERSQLKASTCGILFLLAFLEVHRDIYSGHVPNSDFSLCLHMVLSYVLSFVFQGWGEFVAITALGINLAYHLFLSISKYMLKCPEAI